MMNFVSLLDTIPTLETLLPLREERKTYPVEIFYPDPKAYLSYLVLGVETCIIR